MATLREVQPTRRARTLPRQGLPPLISQVLRKSTPSHTATRSQPRGVRIKPLCAAMASPPQPRRGEPDKTWSGCFLHSIHLTPSSAQIASCRWPRGEVECKSLLHECSGHDSPTFEYKFSLGIHVFLRGWMWVEAASVLTAKEKAAPVSLWMERMPTPIHRRAARWRSMGTGTTSTS
jgi:hypothetical protein